MGINGAPRRAIATAIMLATTSMPALAQDAAGSDPSLAATQVQDDNPGDIVVTDLPPPSGPIGLLVD